MARLKYYNAETGQWEYADKVTVVGGGGGSSEQVQADWNENDETSKAHVKGRTHYMLNDGFEITWDGDTSSIDTSITLQMPMYLVSDKTPTNDELKAAIVTASSPDGETLVQQGFDDMWEIFEGYGFITDEVAYLQMVAVVRSDNATLTADGESIVFPKAGTYFAYEEGSAYVSSLEKPRTAKPLDLKFIPTDELVGHHATGEHSEVFNDYEGNTAEGEYCHAEGYQTTAGGYCCHAEGYGTTANNDYTHAEGYMTAAYCGNGSHAEGYKTEASGYGSHAEGNASVASGNYSHAEGGGTASGHYSHAENYGSASGAGSHAEGNAVANGDYSHAEGDADAFGKNSHAEGTGRTVGELSHAEGAATIATGNYSHAEGYHTEAGSATQHVQGKYNVVDTTNKYAHIVGNGTSAKSSNAHTIDWNGIGWFAGGLKVGGTGQDDTNASEVLTKSTGYTKAEVDALIAALRAELTS